MPTLSGTATRPKDVWSTHKVWVDQYTGPSSYVTGGDALVPADVHLGDIELILFELAINAGGTIYGPVYDTTNQKVLWYVLDTGAEVANGTDLSGFSARLLAIGH